MYVHIQEILQDFFPFVEMEILGVAQHGQIKRS